MERHERLVSLGGCRGDSRAGENFGKSFCAAFVGARGAACYSGRVNINMFKSCRQRQLGGGQPFGGSNWQASEGPTRSFRSRKRAGQARRVSSGSGVQDPDDRSRQRLFEMTARKSPVGSNLEACLGTEGRRRDAAVPRGRQNHKHVIGGSSFSKLRACGGVPAQIIGLEDEIDGRI